MRPGQSFKLLRWPAGAAAQAPARVASGLPPPTGRADAGTHRLEARDRWNTYEIRIQELFVAYDKDRSGALELDEFRELLRDLNAGKEPSDQEYSFIMRLCDKDRDGKIGLGELHYAVRAWHSYCHLDDSVLRLFAEFDTDESGRLDPNELQQLLTAINGGKPVSQEEVLYVMEQADVVGDGAINRSELLGAVSCWYAHVDRRDTDLSSLVLEAVAFALRENNNHREIFGRGVEGMAHAVSLAQGGKDGYSQVGEAAAEVGGASSSLHMDGWPSVESGRAAADDGSVSRPLSVRLSKAAPHAVRSASYLCHVAFPFFLGWTLAFSGWKHRVNDCPRNLDGILLWFGLLVLMFQGLMYVRGPEAVLERARLAIGVMMAVLSVVGFLWTLDVNVREHVQLCGLSLVRWSKLVWAGVPLCACGYGCCVLAGYMKRLQREEGRLKQIIL
mmetsp:Transcript_91851/g.285700  ORF Transcript_91851/g.285700 Transcript_91851/m.285700 type:complete len:445 (+) Transcript_91851:1-1335(+)